MKKGEKCQYGLVTECDRQYVGEIKRPLNIKLENTKIICN